MAGFTKPSCAKFCFTIKRGGAERYRPFFMTSNAPSTRSWLWIGNEFSPAAGLPFSDRGLRYGMSVFETMRLVAGEIQFWKSHRECLHRACLRAKFPFSDKSMDAVCGVLSKLGARDGVARIYVTAGDGGPADVVTESRVALLVEERERRLPSAYSAGICASPHLPFPGGVKGANYWKNAESLREARAQGSDETLLSTPDGTIISACMANVFLHTPNGWVTPCATSGARQGVVRGWVLERLNVREIEVSQRSLGAVDAGFLTSSWIGVMPLNKLDGRSLTEASDVAKLRGDFESLTARAD